MKRAIITPPVLAPAALGELKQWLAITTSAEDEEIAKLLHAALDLCEAFTGLMPLETEAEEMLPATTGWQALQTRPMQAITGVASVAADGARVALAAESYAIDLDADGGGHVRILDPSAATRVAVRFTAGLAADWATLPDSLRHGVIRLAADGYRRRDGERAGQQPPTAVAALWRPWRRVRVA
jgi:uncharacterized phiE125 gp8 family phage protein